MRARETRVCRPIMRRETDLQREIFSYDKSWFALFVSLLLFCSNEEKPIATQDAHNALAFSFSFTGRKRYVKLIKVRERRQCIHSEFHLFHFYTFKFSLFSWYISTRNYKQIREKHANFTGDNIVKSAVYPRV